MLTLEEARQRILDDLAPLDAESVDLCSARGRVLAEPMRADRDVPGFDNSAMDGYAVRSQDTVGASESAPVSLRVVEMIPAGGRPARTLGPGEAARIFTGAPMPPGADAVVMQEDTESAPGTGVVAVRVSVPARRHIRYTGEDTRAGDVVLGAGDGLGPGDIGVLAAQGRALVPVIRRPRVAIVPTGDELVEIDRPLGPGQVPNSNSFLIAAQVSEAGGLPIRCPVAADDPAVLARRLADAAAAADLVITSGGVSVGELDHVRGVLEGAGRIDFWKIAIKPGKPLAYGRLGGKPLVGLPRNPVSSYVTFEVIARPAVLALGGHRRLGRPRLTVRMGRPWKPGRRRELVRARLVRDGQVVTAHPHRHQGSASLSSMVGVDALLDIPAGGAPLAPGDPVEALVLRTEALS